MNSYEDLDQKLNGNLSISIVENSLPLFEVSGKLTEWNFCKTYHSGEIEYFISFYKRDQSSYLAPEIVNTHKEYQYNIQYRNEPSATDIKIPGVIMVVVGGSK